ncbi:alpha/beta hydrolase [Micromonospora sp. NPDC049559]|uniref:alpha/beta fold hydrolase n=1 Tax=Micromonospora sp. NPDC049559 TaxID=3155923 RepID=UPI00343841F6
MPYITVGMENSAPIDLYYEDHGSGRPVVLIHGYPLASNAWEKQMPALVSAGFRCIAYDRRGFGKSSHPGIGYEYDTFATDLEILMNELDLRDAILIGHSMGTGEITRYIARAGSDRVARAVLISALPPMLVKTADNPEGLDQSIFDGFTRQAMADRYAFTTAFFNNFYNYEQNKGKLVSEEVFRANWNLAVSAAPKATIDCISTWMTDFRADVPRVDVPVLIIHGDADNVLPYPATAPRMQAMLPNSELVTLKGAPHAIPWTHAEDVNKAILNFVAAPAMAGSRR